MKVRKGNRGVPFMGFAKGKSLATEFSSHSHGPKIQMSNMGALLPLVPRCGEHTMAWVACTNPVLYQS